MSYLLYGKINEYRDNNRAKKCIYRTVLTNQYNNIGSCANFNQLISSGIVHPTGVLIVPYVSSQAHFSFGDFAWKYPFDCCPGDRACSAVVIALRFGTQGPGFEPGLFHKAWYMPLHGC